MKKKLLAILLLGLTALTACQSDNAKTTEPDTGNVGQSTQQETDEVTEAAKLYYVRTPDQPIEKELQRKVYGPYTDLDEALKLANQDLQASTGYAVYDEDGNFVDGKYSEFVTKLMYNAKHVADYIDMNDYEYGHAQTHPAVTYARRNDKNYRGDTSEKKVSCDRLVCWILYDSGLINQPTAYGLCVNTNSSPDSNLTEWCKKMGFKLIRKEEDLQAGDIVFVKPMPAAPSYPAHTFLFAGVPTNGAGRGQYYRYDAGSVERIRCQGYFSTYSRTGQPFKETINQFMYGYRPVDNELATTPHESARR